MLSRAKALLVCACGRERQHPSCPCGSGFTWAVGGSWGGRCGVLPLLSAGAAQGGSEQPLLSAWHLPCPPCAITGVVPAALLLVALCRVIPCLACSVPSENGPSPVGSGHPSCFLLSPFSSLVLSSLTLVRDCG